ncbi:MULTISPECIES: hypothetical protein [unclassified Methanosarcina]|uniref:hypothetical protein n=1 Tax=unclassified Methanosarcina TaxID=2644672 RepID=UPI00064E419B|nr:MULTISPECIES: hypothetical protein [unclassified Methanosarcina]
MDYEIVSPEENVSIKQDQSILQSAPSKAAKGHRFLISFNIDKRIRGRFQQTADRKKYILTGLVTGEDFYFVFTAVQFLTAFLDP